MKCSNLAAIILIFFTTASWAISFDYPAASLGAKWSLDPSHGNHSVEFMDGSRVQALLLQGRLGPSFACGFFCTGSTCKSSNSSYLFGVFIVITNSASGIVMPAVGFPQLIWSANRNRPVSVGATLELQRGGNLLLHDSDGTLVWETKTANVGVQGISLDASGNLVLHKSPNPSNVVWQSFDHPTDVIVPGQILRPGTKMYSDGGEFFLAMEEEGLVLYAVTNPKPQPYWRRTIDTAGKLAFAQYTNGSIQLFSGSSSLPVNSIPLPKIQSSQYLKIVPDGRLLVFWWDDRWSLGFDLLEDLQQRQIPPKTVYPRCNLPRTCGRFGICTDNGECSCPSSFRPVDVLRPSKGCLPRKPYKCRASGRGDYLEIKGLDYFANDFTGATEGKTLAQCKASCSKDCSCRAAFYRNGVSVSNPSIGGLCYLVSDVLTLRNSYTAPGYNSVAYIKL